MVDKIEWKDYNPFLVSLCNFPNLYEMPGLDPIGLMSL